jgi:hypothetical protein
LAVWRENIITCQTMTPITNVVMGAVFLWKEGVVLRELA